MKIVFMLLALVSVSACGEEQSQQQMNSSDKTEVSKPNDTEEGDKTDWDNAKVSTQKALKDIWDAGKSSSHDMVQEGKKSSAEIWKESKQKSSELWEKGKQNSSDAWNDIESKSKKSWSEGKDKVQELLEDKKDPIKKYDEI